MNGITEIYPHERVDDLHRNGLKIIQDRSAFCFGIDAVLLSDFVKAAKNEKVLDLGTGNGIIPILLTAKTKSEKFTGLEIQRESVSLARRSVELNKLSDIITIVEGDIKNAVEIFKPAEFDVITTNPPYINSGGGLLNFSSPKAIARHEIMVNLDEIVKTTAKLLRTGGRFYMIHRPHRLTDIMYLLRRSRIEPKVLRFVHTNITKEPSMVLIEASRGGNPMTKILPPLVIYDNKGNYTDEVYKIYYE